MSAAYYNYTAMVRFLLDNGANPSVADMVTTPLEESTYSLIYRERLSFWYYLRLRCFSAAVYSIDTLSDRPCGMCFLPSSDRPL